jgi:hypothetical protein
MQELESFKEQTSILINESIEDLTQLIGEKAADCMTYADGIREDQDIKRKEAQTKTSEKLTKIKDVCSNYFSRYDKDLEEVQISMKMLN